MKPIFTAMLRIKNEARWIKRVVESVQPVCERVMVLDDHSTDDTVAICEELGCTVIRSPFTDLHEGRDKQFMLEKVWEAGAQIGDSILCVDGDEVLVEKDIRALKQAVEAPRVVCGSMKIVYLWNAENQARVDGVYKNFRRPSFFKLTRRDLTFKRTEHGGNLHCSSAPAQLLEKCLPLNVRLLHFGYLHQEDRIRKYRWYRRIDATNAGAFEDNYRHVAQGDLPELPAWAQFKHAGPLQIEPLCD